MKVFSQSGAPDLAVPGGPHLQGVFLERGP
jgi:hypothetical protein